MSEQTTQLDLSEVTANLTDDELSGFDYEQYMAQQTETNDETPTDQVDEEDVASSQSASEGEEVKSDEVVEQNTEVPNPEETEKVEVVEPTQVEGEGKPVNLEEKPEAKPKEKDTTATDYQAAYERIFAPFKANGVDIQAQSVEDVIQLMQMGANYHKKMAAFKEPRKILKVLEQHDLMDESKLAYLIDLHNKNPQAIAKLIQDSKVDAYELQQDESAANYVPTPNNVTDAQIELDQVLEDLQSSATYQRTMTVVGTQWDLNSRTFLADNPAAIAVIDSHMSNGIYDQIWPIVVRERTMGRLGGLSDIEAYRTVGDALANQGQLTGQAPAPKQEPIARATPKPKVDPTVEARKRAAAAPAKTAPPPATNTAQSSWTLSDEEFLQKL